MRASKSERRRADPTRVDLAALAAPAQSRSDTVVSSRKRRLIFVNRYFHPDHSATSQMLGDLTFALAEGGEEVVVVASRQLYQQPMAQLARRESVGGVQIHRAGTTRFGRTGLAGRALDYLSFHVTAALAVLRVARAGDVVVTLTDPPLMSVTMAIVARMKRLAQVNWLQDLYPEVAFQSGVRFLDGWIGRSLKWARNASLRSAAANVAIGEHMANRVEREAVPRERISTISNWTRDEEIVPSVRRNWLREEWSLGNKIVVGYSGNLGTAHEADALIEAAEILKYRTDISFLVIGGGSRLSKLQEDVAARGLENFVFQPYQTRDQLPTTLTLPDIHWLSLRAEFEGLIVPSKFYGIAAAGRPMVLIGSQTGELARLIRSRNCGYAVAPNSGEQFAEAIVKLADSPSLRTEMGRNARALIEEGHSMRASLAKWKELLDLVSQASRAAKRSTRPTSPARAAHPAPGIVEV